MTQREIDFIVAAVEAGFVVTRVRSRLSSLGGESHVYSVGNRRRAIQVTSDLIRFADPNIDVVAVVAAELEKSEVSE